jgi:uncharacterized glyoxalase superfamily protein PhnB
MTRIAPWLSVGNPVEALVFYGAGFGAIELERLEVAPVADGYGWRIGRVADPSGHHWEIGKRLAT